MASKQTIGILIEDQLRDYDAIRNAASLSGFLERLQQAAFEKLVKPHTEIRGVAIAADTLVEALTKHGSQCDYELYLPTCSTTHQSKNDQKRYAESHPDRIRIKYLDETIKHRDSLEHLTGWLNLSPFNSRRGGVERSQKLRVHCASQTFPVTTLLHGLSIHRMLHDCFLRLPLGRFLPCDSLIATSAASARAIRRIIENLEEQFYQEFGAAVKYCGRIDIIPLCVDTTQYHPGDKASFRKSLNLKQNTFVILYIGRLSPLKADLLPFLTVLKQLCQDHPEMDLLWIVAGSEEEGYAATLQQAANALQLNKNLRVLLNISDEIKKKLLAASDVFLSLSDSVQESFGLTPIEAMASGLPQVVSDWSGYKDTVSHGLTGFRIPVYWAPCDGDLSDTGSLLGWEYDHLALGQSVAVDLAKTREFLHVLIDNPDLRARMSAESRRRAENLYGFVPVVQQYEALWDELSQIAETSSFTCSEVQYDKPRYSEFFGHFGTTSITDDTRVTITEQGKQLALSKQDASFVMGTRFPGEVLEEGILRDLLQQLAETNSHRSANALPNNAGVQSQTVAELIASVRQTRNDHPDRIRRHILWLIKYNYVMCLGM